MPASPSRRPDVARPGGIAAVFLLAAVPYLLFLDWLLLGTAPDAGALMVSQAIKGWGLVLAAGGVIYLLERRLVRRHRHAMDAQRAAYDATIEGWARALDLRDHETEGHGRRVADLAERLGERLGILGADLLADVEQLRVAATVVRSHHERWDGGGYPDGLAGEEIPQLARVFSVVDVYDALMSDRPYRPAWPKERVLAHLHHESGRQFDPDVVTAFLDLLEHADDAEPVMRAPALGAAFSGGTAAAP